MLLILVALAGRVSTATTAHLPIFIARKLTQTYFIVLIIGILAVQMLNLSLLIY